MRTVAGRASETEHSATQQAEVRQDATHPGSLPTFEDLLQFSAESESQADVAGTPSGRIPPGENKCRSVFRYACGASCIRSRLFQQTRLNTARRGVIGVQRRSIPICRAKDGVVFRTAVMGTTDRKQTEQAMRETEKQLKLLASAVEQVSEGIAVCDLEGNLQFVNDAFARMHGYSVEELLGKHLSVFHTNEQMPSVNAANRRLQETGEFAGEIWHVHRNGATFPTLMQNSLLRDESGHAIGMIGTLRDITDLKRAEEALTESERTHREILNAANDIIVVHDRDTGALVDVNATFCETFGYTQEEARKLTVSDFSAGTPPYDQQNAVRWMRKAFEEGPQLFEWRCKSKNGTLLWAEVNLNHAVIGGVNRVLAVVRDTTERRQAQEALREAYNGLEQRVRERTSELTKANVALREEVAQRRKAQEALENSEERFLELAKTIGEVVWTTSYDESQLMYLNPTAERVYGRTCAEFFEDGELWLKVVHREDRQRVRESAQRLLERGHREIEYRIVRPDGQVRWLLDRARVILDSADQPIGLGGIATDITELKEAEASRRESELRLRGLIENIPDWVALMDGDGVVQLANRGMGGASSEEFTRMSGFAFLAPECQSRCQRLLREALKTGQRQVAECRDTAGAFWECRIVPLVGHEGAQHALVICTDFTERKLAQEKLEAEDRFLKRLLDLQERERKLVAHEIHDGIVQDVVGAKMLYEGIVHEFASETQPRSDTTEQVKKLLDRAVLEGRRLIRELRPMILDEEGIAEAIKHLVASEYCSPSLHVELAVPTNLGRFDPMLEGTVFRIVREALTNVKRHSQSASAVVKLVQKDQRLLLEIRDQGVGFDPDRVSEAHFGLRGIRERARLFGGHAAIESAPGQGSCITVELPVVERVSDPREV